MAKKKKVKAEPVSQETTNTEQVIIRCAYDELAESGALRPHPRNPNKHPDEQIRMLAKIIKYQGWRLPIVVSKRSSYVVTGHGRLYAARLLNLPLVPVNYQTFDSDEQEMAHLVADNLSAEKSEMDEAILGQLRMMQTADFDAELFGIIAAPLPVEIAQVATEKKTRTTEYRCPNCKHAWSVTQ